mgnify:FL=1
MVSAFSEARRAAELLQQFSGFSFLSGQYTALTPFCFRSAMHHTRSCPTFSARRISLPWYARLLGYSVVAYFPGEYLLW